MGYTLAVNCDSFSETVPSDSNNDSRYIVVCIKRYIFLVKPNASDNVWMDFSKEVDTDIQ